MSSNVIEVTNLTQFNGIIKSETPAVFDFHAEWCGPCKIISPIFERLAKEHPNVNFYKVDTDKVEPVAREVGIRAMPTFMAFQNGTKIGQLLGARPAELEKLIKSAHDKAPAKAQPAAKAEPAADKAATAETA